MKNQGSSAVQTDQSKESVFHRPSGPDQDIGTLPSLEEQVRKSLDLLVKWVMKNAVSTVALAWPEAHQRSSSPC
jgi:hypothetical protein